jgi:hypothetical protein
VGRGADRDAHRSSEPAVVLELESLREGARGRSALGLCARTESSRLHVGPRFRPERNA